MRQPPVSKFPSSGTTATDTRTGPQWPTSSPAHQGTRVVPGAEPVVNLRPRVTAPARQKMELDALQAFNESHQSTRQDDPYLATRIKSFETAFGMQSEMPEALDLSKETDETLAMYGLKRGQTDGFGWQCLVAR